MKAAVLRAASAPLVIEEAMLRDVGPHEVAVANRAVGARHSDLREIKTGFAALREGEAVRSVAMFA